jgi:hypothetical protein
MRVRLRIHARSCARGLWMPINPPDKPDASQILSEFVRKQGHSKLIATVFRLIAVSSAVLWALSIWLYVWVNIGIGGLGIFGGGMCVAFFNSYRAPLIKLEKPRLGLSLPSFEISLPFGGGPVRELWVPFWLITTVLIVLCTIVPRRPRIGPKDCPHCGYDLTGNVSGACSECGTRIPEKQRTLLTVSPNARHPE